MKKDELICKLSDDYPLLRLRDEARAIKDEYIGRKVHFRGLLEYSNGCLKDCYYCGLKKSNTEITRYQISIDEAVDAALYAYKAGYGSIVIQTGEKDNQNFTDNISELLQRIKKESHNNLGITLSCGEQSKETYQEWKRAGGHRYLLRIESSNQELYEKIHPKDDNHSFKNRVACLTNLKRIGYQVGSGSMVGLPYQTLGDIADDLLFFKNFDVDMVGIGPYIEHSQTPFYTLKESLMPQQKRYELALRATALLRIMMKDINIAATTALQAIDPVGREKALTFGANIIMPNITPMDYRPNYLLYENKPCTDEKPDQCKGCLESRVKMFGEEICYDSWGDSKHFTNRAGDTYAY